MSEKTIRVLSWNVNGIRAVEKRGFARWLASCGADIVCIQETKADPSQLAEALLRPGCGYQTYWASAAKKGYAGTAVYTKIEPREVSFSGEEAFDREGRVLQLDFGDFLLINAYFPNSQPGGARLGYKLDFCRWALERSKSLAAAGRHFVLCGDYNIAHTEIDLARPNDNEDSPGFLPEERAWMSLYLAAGFVDTFREFHPGKTGCYSWWSYRAASRERNVGWRIDYHCVDAAFMGSVQKAAILPEVTGSDHCPVELVIKVSGL